MAGKLEIEAILLTFFYIVTVNGALFPHSSGGLIEHATVVAHNHLYISGGEFTRRTGNYWGKAHKGTSGIDLTHSWDTELVKTEFLSDSLLLNEQTLFYNRYDDNLGRFGGYPTASNTKLPGLSVLSLQDNLEPHWSTPPYQPPSSIKSTFRGLVARAPDAVYILGGVYFVKDNSEPRRVPGLIRYRFSDRSWLNISSNEHISGFYTSGAAVFIPMYGKEGIILFLGGLTYPSDERVSPFTTGTPQSLAQLLVYDIASRNFYRQSASSGTGVFPRARFFFCAVGVEDSGGGGYDVFVFGGQFDYDNLDKTNNLEDAESVWILSLPSFQWLQVKASLYRHGLTRHTCEVVGKRQMAVIGGVHVGGGGGGGPVGPSIFNLAMLEWTDQYDANAAAYSRAPILTKIVKQKPFPSHWNDPKLEQIFAPSKEVNVHKEAGHAVSSRAAVIAGVVVGVIMGVIFVVGSLWCCLRRKHKMRDAIPQKMPGMLDGDPISELMGQHEVSRVELPIEESHAELPESKDSK